MSLNAKSHVDARDNSDIKIMEPREIYVEGSAYLQLYFLFSTKHEQSVGDESLYLTEFVKRINEIFQTQKDILNVKFTLLNASAWDPDKKAYTSGGFLNAEALKTQLKKQASKVETDWNQTHPLQPISAFVFLAMEEIVNQTGHSQTGVNGRIGGICLMGEKVAAATDNGNYSGVRNAAVQLSLLMGAVYDGESPPGSDFVIGSDGAQDCDPNEGFLMGTWENYQKSFNLSECTPYQVVMGLRQRGPECYGSPEEKKKLVKTTK